MSSFLLVQQYSACLACLTLVVCEMGDKWLYSSYFAEFYFQDVQNSMKYLCVVPI